MKNVRRHIVFSGRVQGVGFRYTACCLARPLGLTGWVKNLWDGNVEMEVQGDPASIEGLINGLESGHFIRIDHMDITECELIPECGFTELWD